LWPWLGVPSKEPIFLPKLRKVPKNSKKLRSTLEKNVERKKKEKEKEIAYL
jgi:hypothetical protein